MPRSNKRKRKNKSVNVSGERSQKIHVSNPQTSVVPNLHGMESLINSSINNSIIPQQMQHSTPNTATMHQNSDGTCNSFAPYGPQGPQSQFAGYLSPIHGQQQQQHQQSQNMDIMQALRSMSINIEQMSVKLNKLDTIERRLTDLERNSTSVNTELKEMKVKVDGIESSMSFINKQYEDQRKEISDITKSVSEITNANNTMMKELNSMRSDFENLNERHLDLQMRSMRDNLIFEGILETQEENTEEILKEFLKSEMNITDEPQFHRVHRMGRKTQGRPRPIVAKFVLFTDREKVRKAAATTLRGKPFGINEQFPKEINDRRKLLYPQYKQAKRQGKKAVMVADKLYVNGMQVFAHPTQPPHQPNSEREQQPAWRSAANSEPRIATTQRYV